jgi:hypothetical protein
MCRRTSSLLAANIAPSSSWVTGQIGRPPSRHRYGQGCSVDSCRRSPPHRQCPNRHRRDPEPADATTAQLGVVACKEPAMCELIPAHARHRLDYRAVTRLRLVPAGPPGRDHTEQLVARKRQRSFPQSFHQPLLGLTGTYWLDDPPDVSSKDSTQQCRVDDPLLSCTQQRGLRVCHQSEARRAEPWSEIHGVVGRLVDTAGDGLVGDVAKKRIVADVWQAQRAGGRRRAGHAGLGGVSGPAAGSADTGRSGRGSP